MAVTTIIPNIEHIWSALDISDPTESQCAYVSRIWPQVENAMRKFVGYSITQHTWTHFLPRSNAMRWRKRKVIFGTDRLMLPEIPVRSLDGASEGIWEDLNGFFGQATGAFAAATKLTLGTDYHEELQQTGLNPYGIIVRWNREWYSEPGNVKAVYLAGWSADELIGNVTDPALDASHFVKIATQAVVEAYNKRGGAGDAAGYSLGSFRVNFDTSDGGSDEWLSKDLKEQLSHYRKIPLNVN